MSELLAQIAADVGNAFFDSAGFAELATRSPGAPFRCIIEDDPDDRVAFVHVASTDAATLAAGNRFAVGAREFRVDSVARAEVGIVTFVCKVVA